MRSGSRCPAFYEEIPPMRWGILDDDGGYFYCITYNLLGGKAMSKTAAAVNLHTIHESAGPTRIPMGFWGILPEGQGPHGYTRGVHPKEVP